METIGLKTIYVLFFIELGTRRVHLAGCSANPNTTWVTQQARQLIWELEEESQDMAYLIHDNDKKFPSSFDTIFTSKGIEIVKTPFQAPQANSFAERWVRSVRGECLDQILIVNERHLRRVLQEYTAYYNMLAHIKASASNFPFQFRSAAQKGQFASATSLAVLFMTTTAIPLPQLQATDRIFTGYSVEKILLSVSG